MQDASPITDAILSSITQADLYRFQPFKAWQLRSRIKDQAHLCPYCKVHLAALNARQVILNFIVPLSLGGPETPDNLLSTCRACGFRKKSVDLVSLPAFAALPDTERSPLLSRRSEILLQSRNHLTPHFPNSKRELVARHLENRFTFPRFRAFAAQSSTCSWIGWSDKSGALEARDAAAVLLRFSAQALPVYAPPISLFQVDNSAFLDGVWSLIERNGLIEQLNIPGLPAPDLDASDWRNCWPRTFANLTDLTRRHSLIDRDPAPTPPRVRSTSYGAKWMRSKRAYVDPQLKLANDRRVWEQAKADYESLIRHNGQGGFPALSGTELLAMRGEILRLEAIYKGIAPKG